MNVACFSWVALVVLSVLGYVQGSCMVYSRDKGQNANTPVTSCTYKDQQGQPITIQVNATYRHLSDCTDCKCHPSGDIHCCTFGTRAGHMSFPSTCTLVEINKCESKLVLKSDERTPCMAGPVYPSSTESPESPGNTDSQSGGNAGTSVTSHAAMSLLTVVFIMLCQ